MRWDVDIIGVIMIVVRSFAFEKFLVKLLVEKEEIKTFLPDFEKLYEKFSNNQFQITGEQS